MTKLTLPSSSGGYAILLRASQNAIFGPASQGTFYAVHVRDVALNGSVCSAYLEIAYFDGTNSWGLNGKSISCHDGMELRAWIRGTHIQAYLDGNYTLATDNSSLAAGMPGVSGWSMGAGNGITNVQLRPIDSTPPPAIGGTSMATYPFAHRIDFHWRPVVDNTGGIGNIAYSIYRDGSWLTMVDRPSWTDETVAPSTTYEYTIYAVDDHLNSSPALTFNVTTPPEGAIDARRIGVRPDGAYWGGGGDQIDVRSGNVNLSLPLFKAVGRGGWGVTFALSYNSQQWRQDSGGDWKLGQDIGLGFGWKLLAGAVLPVYQADLTVHHYKYIDSTGAEYRLDANNGNVWTSKETGIYVAYDANQRRLYFPDGSFWLMGAESSGVEADGGTLYPTLMQDTNGNQISVKYDQGVGAASANTSGRLTLVADSRAKSSTACLLFYPPYNSCSVSATEAMTFALTWNSDSRSPGVAPPWIGRATDRIASTTYWFTVGNLNLYSPISGAAYGSTRHLLGAPFPPSTDAHPITYVTYGDGSTGEVASITNGQHGRLLWDYAAVTYPGGRVQREAANRYVAYHESETPKQASFVRDPDTSKVVHGWVKVNEGNGSGQKQWTFDTGTASPYLGLVTVFAQRNGEGQADLARKTVTWTQDATLRPYAGAVLNEQDPGQSYGVTSKTEQTVDAWGNVTQSKLYDYGNLSVPAKTYTNTFLSGSNYTSRYIRNRLLTSSVSDGTSTVTLVSNTFDDYVSWSYDCTGDGSGFNSGLGGYPTTPTQWDTTYGPSVVYRGNLVKQSVPGRKSCMAYTVTGAQRLTSDSSGKRTTEDFSALTNYTAPDTVTSNGLASSLSWDAWLNLTQGTGANGDTVALEYDSAHRPPQPTGPAPAG